MTLAALALAEGVPQLTLFAVLGLGLLSLGFLGFELRKREGAAVWVLLSGLLSLLLVAAAVLRRDGCAIDPPIERRNCIDDVATPT